jgi:hypothetical protein
MPTPRSLLRPVGTVSIYRIVTMQVSDCNLLKAADHIPSLGA